MRWAIASLEIRSKEAKRNLRFFIFASLTKSRDFNHQLPRREFYPPRSWLIKKMNCSETMSSKFSWRSEGSSRGSPSASPHLHRPHSSLLSPPRGQNPPMSSQYPFLSLCLLEGSFRSLRDSAPLGLCQTQGELFAASFQTNRKILEIHQNEFFCVHNI